jgi:hypothetical protein
MVVVKYPQNSRSFQASFVHNIVELFATRAAARNGRIVFPVSYTHLTLPTTPYV